MKTNNYVKFSLNSEHKVIFLYSTWRSREQTWSFELLKDGWNQLLQAVKGPMTHVFKNSYDEQTNAAMDPEL